MSDLRYKLRALICGFLSVFEELANDAGKTYRERDWVDMEFEDEVDTPANREFDERFAKYEALRSFAGPEFTRPNFELEQKRNALQVPNWDAAI